jgi:hypothetical protein
MRLLLVPLDERPCNYRFPPYVARLGGASLAVPPLSLMGRAREPADIHGLSAWVETHLGEVDALLLCLDTLALGGLIPSRLDAGITDAEAADQIAQIAHWRQHRPELKIVAHMAIQRTNDADDAGEERVYWAHYGRRICRYGVLQDRRERVGLSGAEAEELDALTRTIPAEHLADYQAGRARNHALNLAALDLTEAGILDALLLTQDDSSPFGWGAREQRHLRQRVRESPLLLQRALIYPGADEVGSTMVARALTLQFAQQPSVAVHFSSMAGPFVVPRYEDRPQLEGIKAQIVAAGGHFLPAFDAAVADVRLFVNSPSEAQGEAPTQPDPAVDGAGRNLAEFCQQILSAPPGKVSAVADLAYANGADNHLMAMLAAWGCWPQIDVYSGWNTSGNAVGTAIAAALAMALGGTRSSRAAEEFLVLRVLEDWYYQANVRQELAWSRAGVPEGDALATLRTRFRQVAQEFLAYRKSHHRLERIDLEWPWARLFEIGIDFDLIEMEEMS